MVTLSISCSEADAEKRRYCCKGLACGTVARLEAAGHDKIRGMARFQQAVFRWLALLGLAATAVMSLAADSGLRAQAAALKARGDAAGALALFEQVAVAEPRAADVRDEAGFLLVVLGRQAEGIARFEEAIRLQPGYAPAQYHLGVALWLRGERERAIAALREAVRLAGTNADYRYRLAVSLLETGAEIDVMFCCFSAQALALYESALSD